MGGGSQTAALLAGAPIDIVIELVAAPAGAATRKIQPEC